MITAVTGDFCPACDEAIFDLVESTRISAEMLEFNKQVNAKSKPIEKEFRSQNQ